MAPTQGHGTRQRIYGRRPPTPGSPSVGTSFPRRGEGRTDVDSATIPIPFKLEPARPLSASDHEARRDNFPGGPKITGKYYALLARLGHDAGRPGAYPLPRRNGARRPLFAARQTALRPLRSRR